MIRRPPRATPFPYTTPFRSKDRRVAADEIEPCLARALPAAGRDDSHGRAAAIRVVTRPHARRPREGDGVTEVHRLTLGRSEEHTSELQSRQYLVCRLVLGKK